MYVILHKTYPQSKWKTHEKVYSNKSIAEEIAYRSRIAGAYKAVVRFVDLAGE